MPAFNYLPSQNMSSDPAEYLHILIHRNQGEPIPANLIVDNKQELGGVALCENEKILVFRPKAGACKVDYSTQATIELNYADYRTLICEVSRCPHYPYHYHLLFS